MTHVLLPVKFLTFFPKTNWLKTEYGSAELRLKNAIKQSSISFIGHHFGESVGYSEVLQTLNPRFQEYLKAAARENSRSARELG